MKQQYALKKAIQRRNVGMSTILKEVLSANEAYAKNFGDKAKLSMPQVAILLF